MDLGRANLAHTHTHTHTRVTLHFNQWPPQELSSISGNGSNLQAIIDAIKSAFLNASIVLVISNKGGVRGLTLAENAGIPTLTFPLKPYRDAGKTRLEYDIDLAARISEQKPDLVILAGFMHILLAEFLSRFPSIFINLHPALPGQFDGAHAIERAYADFKAGKIDHTGVMVHHVIAEVDQGAPLLIEEVPILEGDSLEDLEARIHIVEHRLIVAAAKKFLNELQAASKVILENLCSGFCSRQITIVYCGGKIIKLA